MLTVGLTGNIASGKSEVARRLAQLGATLIDADVLAREVVEPGTPALSAIVERWGTRVLRGDGHLDRARLRAIVFESRAELEALNAIVHPRVEERRQALLKAARARGDRIVVCDIPLLFEKQMERAFDFVVLVDASETLRRERLVTQRALSIDAANGMIAAQMPSAEKRQRASYVIDNDGTLDDLDAQVRELWSRLDALAHLAQ